MVRLRRLPNVSVVFVGCRSYYLVGFSDLAFRKNLEQR